MKRLLILTSVLVLFLAMIGVAGADLINGGFETGHLTGWTNDYPNNLSPYFGMVTRCDLYNYDGDIIRTITPIEGSYFLDSQFEVGPTYQSLTMNAGDTLSGYALLDTVFISLPQGVSAWVKILDSNGNEIATAWKKDGYCNWNRDQWDAWSWTADSAGTYYLTLWGPGFFDANKLTSAVPLPSTVLLLGSGLLGLGAVGWRRKRG